MPPVVTRVMGILNVTPDSFSDGGRHLDPGAAAEAAFRMAEEGACWIDVGGESTRPGADPVPVEEELRRVLPVLSRLAGRIRIPLSIDTSKPAVARAALAAGASVVNDVTGFRDPDMIRAVSENGAAAIVMHMRGTPRDMQRNPVYGDVLDEVAAFLRERASRLVEAGVPPERVYLDPGIGFGKTLAHNVALLARVRAFAALGHPLVVGPSRKSFLGALTGTAVDERLPGTLAAVAWLTLQGVQVVRVHDVKAAVDCIRVVAALASEERQEAA